jgi:hypothetical protein
MLRVCRLWFMVYGFRFRVLGFGLRVYGVWCMVYGSGCTLSAEFDVNVTPDMCHAASAPDDPVIRRPPSVQGSGV